MILMKYNRIKTSTTSDINQDIHENYTRQHENFHIERNRR